MPISENAKAVLEKRYLIKDEKGQPIETVDGLFHRVARAVASADSAYEQGDVRKSEEEFYKMMSELDFLPNSPTLMNAGRHLGQLSAVVIDGFADIADDFIHLALRGPIQFKRLLCGLALCNELCNILLGFGHVVFLTFNNLFHLFIR